MKTSKNANPNKKVALLLLMVFSLLITTFFFFSPTRVFADVFNENDYVRNAYGVEFQNETDANYPAYTLDYIKTGNGGLKLRTGNVYGPTGNNSSPFDVARLGIGKDPTVELDVFGTIAGNILQLFSGASGLGQIQFNGTNFQWRPGTTGTWNEFGGSITGGDCPTGQFATGVNVDGSPKCAAPSVTSESDPVYSSAPASGISSADITKWNSALTSFTETDPTVSAWAKAATKPSYSFSEITGAKPTYAFSEILNSSGYMNYKPANIACATGEVLKYDTALNSGAGGWKCAAYSYADLANKPAADSFTSAQVTNLTGSKLADGSTPWASIVSSFWTSITGGITYADNVGIGVSAFDNGAKLTVGGLASMNSLSVGGDTLVGGKVGINDTVLSDTAALLQVGGSGYFANDIGVLGSGSFGGSLSASGGARFPRQAGTNVTPGRGPSISLESPSNNVTTSKGTPDFCDVVGECSSDNTPNADLAAEYVCPVGSGGLSYSRDVFRDTSNNSWHQTITCVAGTDSYSLSTNAGTLEFANTSGAVKLNLNQNGNVSFFGSLIIPSGLTTGTDAGKVLTLTDESGTASWQPSASGADQWGTQVVQTNTTNGYITGTGVTGNTLNIDTTKIQRRVSSTCAAGSSIRLIAEDGTVTCETDDTGATFASGGATAGFVKNNASGQLIGGNTIAVTDLPTGVDTSVSDDITTLTKGTGIDITGSGNSRTIAIDSAFLGSVRYQGTWNASSNAPSLAASPAADTKGYYYVVSAAGIRFSITWATGDYIISNGSAWQKIDNTDVQAAITAATDGWDKDASDDLTGGGTSGKIAKWSGGKALGDSVITENADKVGIGTGDKLAALTVKGKASFSASGKVENANAGNAVSQYGGTVTKFLSEVGIGDYITIGTETKTVIAISSDTALTVGSNFTNSHSNATMTVYPAIARFDTSAGTEKITVNESGTLIADNVQVDSFIGAIEGWFSSKLQSANGLWVGSGDGTQVIANEGGVWKWKGDTTGLAGPAGADGASGFTSLVKTTAEAAGANCAAGGLKIEAGLDDGTPSGTANNGTLETEEVTQTEYICNGAQGAAGINGTNGTDGTNGVIGTPGSVWFTGATDPNSTSPSGSIIGDFYLRTGATGGGDVYKKTAASTWTLQTNITGPVGPLVAGAANQTLRYGSGVTGDLAGWKATSGLVVDSGGKVGIGTANPGAKLQVGNGATVILAAGATACPPGYGRTIDAVPTGASPGTGDTCQEMGGSIKSTGSHTINNTSPTIYLQDIDQRSAMIHNNSNQLYFLRSNGNNSTSWQQTGGAWPLVLNLDTNAAIFGGSISTNAYGNNTDGVSISAVKSRFTDPLVNTSKTKITTGDDLLYLRGYGWDGNNNTEAARIQFDTEGTVAQLTSTTGRVPGVLRFFTADNPADSAAASTLRERMSINSSGAVGIGMAPFPGDKLSVRGAATLTGNLIVMDDTAPALPSGLHVDGTGNSYFMGNVGIGMKLDLAQRLNVNGGIQITGGDINMRNQPTAPSQASRKWIHLGTDGGHTRSPRLLNETGTEYTVSAPECSENPVTDATEAERQTLQRTEGSEYPTTATSLIYCSDWHTINSGRTPLTEVWGTPISSDVPYTPQKGLVFTDLYNADATWTVKNFNGVLNFINGGDAETSPPIAGGQQLLSLTQSGDLTIYNILNIKGNSIDLGYDVAGREENAGKIGYKKFSDSLDIVGAGTAGTNRKIKFWNEGGATFTGSVGIGTAAPKGLLHLSAADESVSSALSIRQSNDNSFGFDFSLDQSVDGKMYLDSVNADSKVNVMTFDRSTGSVGIGTASPGATLDVNGSLKLKNYTYFSAFGIGGANSSAPVCTTSNVGTLVVATNENNETNLFLCAANGQYQIVMAIPRRAEADTYMDTSGPSDSSASDEAAAEAAGDEAGAEGNL